mmetsp:Transcript_166/g.430  ORF Transcript_166/g.430 Transcript_166/m.430 type:complete len:248 (+) Transcript_166:530-1273(+)
MEGFDSIASSLDKAPLFRIPDDECVVGNCIAIGRQVGRKIAVQNRVLLKVFFDRERTGWVRSVVGGDELGRVPHARAHGIAMQVEWQMEPEAAADFRTLHVEQVVAVLPGLQRRLAGVRQGVFYFNPVVRDGDQLFEFVAPLLERIGTSKLYGVPGRLSVRRFRRTGDGIRVAKIVGHAAEIVFADPDPNLEELRPVARCVAWGRVDSRHAVLLRKPDSMLRDRRVVGNSPVLEEDGLPVQRHWPDH